MNKFNKLNKILIALVALILLLFVIKFFTIKTDQDLRINHLFQYIPQSAAWIIETENMHQIVRQLADNENNIWKHINDIYEFKIFQNEIQFIDSLLNNSEKISSYLSNNLCTVSFHFVGKKEPEVLYQMALPNANNANDFYELFNNIFSQKFQVAKKEYENTEITIIKAKNSNLIFYLYLNEHSVLFSSSEILTEETIRKQKKANNFKQNKTFNTLYNKVNKNALANIFVNMQNLPEVMQAFTSNNISLKTLNDFSDWLAFDVILETNTLYFKGLAHFNPNYNKYLDVFKNQLPHKSEIIKIMPENTMAFISVSFTKLNELNTNYKIFLKQNNALSSYQTRTEAVNSKAGMDLNNFFDKNISNEISLIYTTDGVIDEPLIIAKLTDTEQAQEALLNIHKNTCKADSVSVEENTMGIAIDAENTVEILRINILNPLSLFYGNIFKSNAKYYAVFKNYLLISAEPLKIESFVNAYSKEQFFENTEAFKFFNKMSNKKNTILVYSNPDNSKKLYYYILNQKYATWLKLNEKKLNKFLPFFIEVYPSDDKNFYHVNFQLFYNKDKKVKIEKNWELLLDTLSFRKPQLLKNHYNGDFEIFTQDESNNIYLIDRNGNILFKRHIKYKIIGEAKQIDYYTNTKLQILFVAGNELYLIDRKGENVEHFPVLLPQKPTSSVAVFDYEKDRKYRYFLAFGKKILAFDKEGKILDNWKFKAQTNITKTPRHVRIDDNDYVIVHSKSKFYILNRKGEERVKLKPEIEFAENASFYVIENEKPYILSSNAKGNLVKIYFDGTSDVLIDNDAEEEHFLAVSDLNVKNSEEFFYLTEKEIKIYNSNFKIIKKYQNKENIFSQPLLFSFANKQKAIGFFDKNNQKIYLYNSDFKLNEIFPLPSISSFVINFPEKVGQTVYYSLICNDENGKLISYKIDN